MKLSTIARRSLRGPHSLKGWFKWESLTVAPVLAPGMLKRARVAARSQRRTRAQLLRDWRAMVRT